MPHNMPTIQPMQATALATESRPDDAVDLAVLDSSSAASAAPQLVPPTETAEVSGVGAWLTGKQIVGLWSNAASRNSWVSIAGMGWRKLYNVGDTGITEMTMLATHARAGGRQCSLRIEADNQVHEIYVW
jgi:hypothetical protein